MIGSQSRSVDWCLPVDWRSQGEDTSKKKEGRLAVSDAATAKEIRITKNRKSESEIRMSVILGEDTPKQSEVAVSDSATGEI